ncbi:MAG: hypothetical protein Q8S03_00840 [Brevundimonas sp.]|uniref:hypothetical protein n=1 Tax=Brevundimonas sp. TaxID=1871086 RepID=UPI002732E27D|nr:hypothetical protein [Brevundimonas sp.]MDP3403200.1 hypothetical protein [Brevundimonas sp.]
MLNRRFFAIGMVALFPGPALAGVEMSMAAIRAAALAGPPPTTFDLIMLADPTLKGLMIALFLAVLAALAVTGRKVMSGPSLTGGSNYLQALRLGGPLLGLLGAAYSFLMTTIAIANIGQQPSYPVLAPSVTGAAFVVVLGLGTGLVALICNWIIEARIDHTVLRP